MAIRTRPDAELVNTMLDDAICNLMDREYSIVHFDKKCPHPLKGHFHGKRMKWQFFITQMIVSAKPLRILENLYSERLSIENRSKKQYNIIKYCRKGIL